MSHVGQSLPARRMVKVIGRVVLDLVHRAQERAEDLHAGKVADDRRRLESAGGRVSRRGLLIGAVLLAVGGLVASAVATGFLVLAACRGFIGLATGIVMVNSLALIAETAPVRKRALAGSFVFAGVGVGIFASGTLVPMLEGFGLAASWWAMAIAGVVGSGLAIWGWWRAPPAPRWAAASLHDPSPDRSPLTAWPVRGLLMAHLLFSAGIVPHSLYWVDFLTRELGHGIATAGVHWSVVGLLAFLGPLLCAALAERVGTRAALVIAFMALAVGIAAPGLWPVVPVLYASSALFGAQPGLSALMAARARDLGAPEAMGQLMRAMILANAIGAVAGGLVVPWCLLRFGTQAPLFVIGGAAMLVAAVAAFPFWSEGERS